MKYSQQKKTNSLKEGEGGGGGYRVPLLNYERGPVSHF